MTRSNRVSDWEAEFVAAPRLDQEVVAVERERAFAAIARLMDQHGIDAAQLVARIAPDYHKEVPRAARAPSSYDPIFGHR